MHNTVGARDLVPLRMIMMAQNSSKSRSLGWPVYLALALLAIVFVGFLIAIAVTGSAPQPTPEAVSAESYRAQVDALLAVAQPEAVEAVVTKYGCSGCHRDGAANDLVPSWVGVGERAATRRPPMPADAYLYESIVYPAAYLVEGYANLMPKDFAQRMSEQELADVIAYLLTPDAH